METMKLQIHIEIPHFVRNDSVSAGIGGSEGAGRARALTPFSPYIRYCHSEQSEESLIIRL